MIPIKVYGIEHNAIRINMTDERFLYNIVNCPSDKINSIDYVNEDGSIGFILTHPNQKIEMNGKTYHMDSAYDVDAFIQTFNTLVALEDLK